MYLTLGLLFGLMVGIFLGLLGAGGSILTVPALTYALNLSPKAAISSALLIVCISSGFGSFLNFKSRQIHFKTALLFLPSSLLCAFFGAKTAKMLRGEVQLVLFAFLMIIAAILMLRKKTPVVLADKRYKVSWFLVIGGGALVGFLTGLLGVGGGFMIVPTLTLLAGLPIKVAVGTSQLLISLNAASGFVGYWGSVEIPWEIVLCFASASLLGTFLGIRLSKKISAESLKKIFAIFLLLIATFILIQNKNMIFS